jgi:thiol peroxidase
MLHQPGLLLAALAAAVALALAGCGSDAPDGDATGGGDAGAPLPRRPDEVTMRGVPVVLLGPKLEPGDPAPDAVLVDPDMKEVALSDFEGVTLLVSAVPSLDTKVCDLQTQRFNAEAAKRESVVFLTVSMDLPFAQQRWCGAREEAPHVVVASDHRDADFGRSYGVLIEGKRLLARSIFVIGPDRTLRYVEIVPELTSHPDYAAALAAADAAVDRILPVPEAPPAADAEPSAEDEAPPAAD